MPLFYFRPFDFHADKNPPRGLFHFDMQVVGPWIIIGVLGLALFVAFVVVPAIMVLQETLP